VSEEERLRRIRQNELKRKQKNIITKNDVSKFSLSSQISIERSSVKPDRKVISQQEINDLFGDNFVVEDKEVDELFSKKIVVVGLKPERVNPSVTHYYKEKKIEKLNKIKQQKEKFKVVEERKTMNVQRPVTQHDIVHHKVIKQKKNVENTDLVRSARMAEEPSESAFDFFNSRAGIKMHEKRREIKNRNEHINSIKKTKIKKEKSEKQQAVAQFREQAAKKREAKK